MSKETIKVNEVEYTLLDKNVTSSEYGLAAFGGYMAFNGTISQSYIEAQVKKYKKALKNSGKYTNIEIDKLAKKYADKIGLLAGKNISRIFTVTSGIITGVFDKNMNPDKSLDEILTPIGIDTAMGIIGSRVGMWAGVV